VTEQNVRRGRPTPVRINDYGFISDCHSTALVSRSGSIDWCCMPRVDSSSCFDSLLDGGKGGRCRISPAAPFRTARRYLPDTLVLEPRFEGDSGAARLLDCFTMTRGGRTSPHQQALRVLEGLSGSLDFEVEVEPRFDYGAIRPWIRRGKSGHFAAIGGKDGLVISGNFPLEMTHRHRLECRCGIRKGEKRRLSILYRRPETIDEGAFDVPGSDELDRRLAETVEWWQSWASKGKSVGAPYGDSVRRSAIVLKGLTNAPTGAIAAAATTSLPEVPGGVRNWDYRFSWVRDSCFTVRALVELGHLSEADGFRRFIERSAAGNSEDIQVLFGVGGERRLYEYEVEGLSGFNGSRPVRVGNAAATQRQLDVYGELLDLAWRWHEAGHTPDEDYWDFLVSLVNDACRLWSQPDQGIWEMRGRPRHFVQSKAMCWIAADRGIKLAENTRREAPLERWRAARDEIGAAIEKDGFDAARGAFTQAFGERRVDAALLLLPLYGFIPFDDERMRRTVKSIRKDLEQEGLIRRYAAASDDLEGRDGAFMACTFWLAECLARQGDLEEAHGFFRNGLAAGNDLGLFAEEFDPGSGQMLGNFPQGLSHLSLITAALAIAGGEERQKEAGGKSASRRGKEKTP
jgi:GH15 family glucan-1,4-alpha-glucosidase